jgi:hypothetical protein
MTNRVLPDVALQDEPASASLAEVASTPRGQATIALEIIALLAMLPFLYIEAATIIEYGKTWLNAQNIIDALTYVNQVRLNRLFSRVIGSLRVTLGTSL